MRSHWESVNYGGSIISDTPQSLWENAMAYFKWCDENPIVETKSITVGKDAGSRYQTESVRPYTVKGLCLHCNVMEEYLVSLMSTKDSRSDYYIVASKIMYIIHTQNLEMATVGSFNAMLVSKALNMEAPEPVAEAVKIEIVGDLPALQTSEADVLKNLDLEIVVSENGN